MKKLKELAVVLAVCALVAAWFHQRPEEDGVELPTLVGQLPATDRSVVIVELDAGHRMGSWARRELEAMMGLKVRQVSLSMPESALESTRKQYDAEKILAELGQVERGAKEIVIAVTSQDIYTSARPEWRYCFGSHATNGSVLSSARMGRVRFGGSLEDAASQARLRKMLLRYALERVYQLPRNDDPTSLLYRSILGPADLDRMKLRL